ncbi:MAG: hypothetical protein ACOC9T_00610 [Myxococcota bacterium]
MVASLLVCCGFAGVVALFAPESSSPSAPDALAPPPADGRSSDEATSERPAAGPAPAEEEAEPTGLERICADVDSREIPPFAQRAYVAIEPIVGADDRVLLRIHHNLPEGATVMTGLSGQDFSGQAKATAKASCIVTGPFGPTGGLPMGRYTASVSTPLVLVQPDDVKNAMGKHGRNLKGPLVRRDEGERFVEAEETFTLGNPEEAEAADRERAETRLAIRRSYADLVRDGRRMEKLRQSSSLEAARRCGERMRELQGQARVLGSRAEKVGDRHLAGISGMASLCVSCLRDARENCDITTQHLKDWDRINRDL